jgi:hypothetical protein
MKEFIKKIEWGFDYYILYFMYKESKFHRYRKYMKDKWGTE